MSAEVLGSAHHPGACAHSTPSQKPSQGSEIRFPAMPKPLHASLGGVRGAPQTTETNPKEFFRCPLGVVIRSISRA